MSAPATVIFGQVIAFSLAFRFVHDLVQFAAGSSIRRHQILQAFAVFNFRMNLGSAVRPRQDARETFDVWMDLDQSSMSRSTDFGPWTEVHFGTLSDTTCPLIC